MTSATAAARRIVVLGGTSEIALAIVAELLRAGPREVVLVGRDGARLDAAVSRLTRSGCSQASSIELDADDTHRHEEVVAEAIGRLGGADLVVVAVGLLGERGGVPRDVRDALDVLRINVVGAGSLLISAARALSRQGSGTIVVLSSVAGERVRPANVVYGAAKAGLDALAQGLGDALHTSGVRVMIVRPGFVNTRMTRGLDPAPMSVDPDDVAREVVRGLEHGKHVVWAPRSLRWVMLAMRAMPRPLLRRLPT